MWIGFNWLRIASTDGNLEFIDQLDDYQLLKKNPTLSG